MIRIILLSAVFFCACSSGKNVATTSIVSIEFGSGGGITGEVNSHVLSKNGTLTFNSETIEVEKKELSKLFNQAEKLKNIKLRDPRNFYYYLDIKSNDSSNRIVWGAETKDLKPEIKTLYENLIQLTTKK